MRGLLLALLFFPFSAFPECLEVQDEYLVVGSLTKVQEKSTENLFDLSLISSPTSVQLKSGSYTNEVYLLKTENISDFKNLYPKTQVQKNCFVESYAMEDEYSSYHTWIYNIVNLRPRASTSKKEVIIAIIDTGVDLNHPDLVENLWTNTKELQGTSGIDDDNNGYIDDIYGFDFGDNDPDPSPPHDGTYADIDHGTHVAGLASARGYNSQGINGYSQNSAKIMAIKGFRTSSPSKLSDFLKAIYYAVDNGATIINASWGIEKTAELAEKTTAAYAISKGALIVAAAGNDGFEAKNIVPASLPNVVTVSSINSQSKLSTFSNYGPEVNFVVPGGDGVFGLNEYVLSTGFSTPYLQLKGTSMAAPIFAGLLSLIYAHSKDISIFQALYVFNETSEKLNLNGNIYRKPNIQRALDYIDSGANLPEAFPNEGTLDGYIDLSSYSEPGGGGGCSKVLGSQEGLNISGGVNLFTIFFFLVPLIISIILRFYIKKKKDPIVI